MAHTDAQYQALLSRVVALENLCNDLVVAIDHFVTTSQVNGVSTLIQQDISALADRVEAVELRVTNIENEPLT